MPLTVVPRKTWGAKDALFTKKMPPEAPALAEYIDTKVNSCFTNDECRKQLQELQEQAFKENISDLRYNFLIGGDGKVYEGRGWETYPTDTDDWHGYMIGFIGQYTNKLPPAPNMVEAMHELIKYGKEHNYIKSKYIHWVMTYGKQRSYYN